MDKSEKLGRSEAQEWNPVCFISIGELAGELSSDVYLGKLTKGEADRLAEELAKLAKTVKTMT